MGLREEKRDRTRAQLLAAALALFDERGFEATTLADIATTVGVSTRTLLRYFATKEEIITSWLEDAMNVFRDELAAGLASEVPTEALHRAARAMLSYYETHADHFCGIERAIAGSPAVSAQKQLQMEQLAREAGAALAKRAGGSAKAALVADVHAGTTMALVRAAIRAWVGTGTRKSLLQLFDDAESVTR